MELTNSSTVQLRSILIKHKAGEGGEGGGGGGTYHKALPSTQLHVATAICHFATNISIDSILMPRLWLRSGHETYASEQGLT